MKSFSILRTNVGLTANVKVVIDSFYNLFLESFSSTPELESTRFKKFQFNKTNFYDELVPYFFRNFPVDLAFLIKYDNDNSSMSTNFSNQYDDIYQMGARNIHNNKNFKEEFEFLAPLYVFKHSTPKNFVIFRLDGPGLMLLNKDNFRSEFLTKIKTVKLFDLTTKSPLGEWIDRNFTSNKSFPSWSLEVDFRNLEFTKWVGIDYDSGGFTFKSRFLDDSLENENTLFDLEKSFFDGFHINKIIYPQIINFNFLFDDTPATPTSLRKWSLNRYCGFYLDDMEVIDCITPFKMSILRSDVRILDGNILESDSGSPFVNRIPDNKTMWVEYGGEFYRVERFTSTETNKLSKVVVSGKVQSDEYSDVSTTKYRIISDIDLSGQEDLLNTKQCIIDSNNRILNSDSSTYSISDFESGDIHLIEIDGLFHNLILEDGYLKIHTDYGFSTKQDYRFEYFINSPDPNYYKFIDISPNIDPICFKIYRLKFTDIKDFDTQIIDSEFSKFEYEKKDELIKTEEPKIYTTDLRSTSNPATFNDYIYNGQVELIPCASDYTANLETFRISDNSLTSLWRKNPIHCRFGYQNSISYNDYPYLLNNNDIHEDFNKTVDTNQIIPSRPSRNLDYFYTINSGTTSYLHHTLHIERNYGSIQDTSFQFELDKYLNQYTYSVGTISMTYSNNYFNYLFENEQTFLGGNISLNTKKYSLFDIGDKSIPNTTLFKGLKFRIFEVDNIKVNGDNIDTVNIFSSNQFSDYKFSILLSQNDKQVSNDGEIENTRDWGYFIDSKYNNGFGGGTLSFITSLTQSPSNISIGDMVEIKQFYPYSNSDYDGLSSVVFVGNIGGGVYGFSVNKNFGITSSTAVPGHYKINQQWKIIRNWEYDVQYYQGEYVFYNDVIHRVTNDNIVVSPTHSPSIDTSNYQVYQPVQPIWNPEYKYQPKTWVYRQGDYYLKNSTEFTGDRSGDFWHTSFTYSIGHVAGYEGRFYINNSTQSLGIKPNQRSRDMDLYSYEYPWIEDPYYNTSISSSTYSFIWDVIQLWNENEYYDIDAYIVHNDILYRSITDLNIGNLPDISSNWDRIYSFEQNNSYIYGTQGMYATASPENNPIVKMNGNFYLCEFNNDYVLNSGITIYINKKWKNILVNIEINDNTCENIDNSERDFLYKEINSRLTAANFIRQINDLDSKYDFSNYTNYVIIEEDGSTTKHSFSSGLESLPYILVCESADDFELKNNTLIYNQSTVDKNILKPIRELVDGNIDNIQKLNYYNDIPLGCEILKNEDSVAPGTNYNGSTNTGLNKKSYVDPKGSSSTSTTIHRHSGPYMPIFYDIQLFKSISNHEIETGGMNVFTTITTTQSHSPMTIFNESLSLFGVLKQRILSKVNRKDNILKLRNNDSIKSIYPMLDEFGYSVSDFFIFKSTWDYEYHIESSTPVINSSVAVTSIPVLYMNEIAQNTPTI